MSDKAAPSVNVTRATLGLPSPEHLLEVAHVAHRLRVSQRYVWKIIREGKLPVIRLGKRLRVQNADLEAFIDALRDEPELRRSAVRRGGQRIVCCGSRPREQLRANLYDPEGPAPFRRPP